MKNSEKPPFIVLAGCEGSGKTTQIANLKERYPNAVFFREPGSSEFAEKEMRRLLLTSEYAKTLTPFEQMCLAFAGRKRNYEEIVIPSASAGKMVISDRFDCCTFAYQVRGMQGDELSGLFNAIRASIIPPYYSPDLYIILDISPEEGMKRVAKREIEKRGTSNHFDEKGFEFHSRVRDGYIEFARGHNDCTVIIDAHPSKEVVWASIEAELNARNL